jgi:hypothetical protein
MHLTEEDLREFIQIWSEEFGEAIALAEARRRASDLLQLYLLLSSPQSGDSS